MSITSSPTAVTTFLPSLAQILFAALLLASCAPPPPLSPLYPESVSPPPLPLIHTATLKNGMRLMVVENHRAPLVLHTVTYKVGSMDEQPHERGIAHLLEHARLRDTTKQSETTINTFLESLGGVNNASTHNDFTRYYQRVQPQYLEEVMALEAERLQHVLINPKKFKHEKKVVLEERNFRVNNTPQSLFYEEYRHLAFRVHPYRNPIIGFDADIQSLTLKDTLAFLKRYYQPHNASISIVGDVSFEKVLALAEKHYAPIPNIPPKITPLPNPLFFEPPLRAPTYHVAHNKKASTSSLSLSWKTTSFADTNSHLFPDDYRHIFLNAFHPKISPVRITLSLILLAEILNNESLEFFQHFVHEEEYAHDIGVSYRPWQRGPSLFSIYAQNVSDTLSPQNLATPFISFLSHPSFLNEDALLRAKNSVALSFAYSFDDLENLDFLLTHLSIHNRSPNDLENYIQDLSLITLEEIQAVAKTLFSSPPFVNIERPSPPS